MAKALIVGIIAAFALLWGFNTLPAQAQTQMDGGNLYSLSELQHLCDSQYDVDAGICAGYVMGVADALQQQGRACIGANIRPETLMDNIRRGWTQNTAPSDTALLSVQDIITQRFPCR